MANTTKIRQKESHKRISFASLQESDFPLIHQWFNKPHIQAFYSLRDWTLDEVKKKLSPESQKKKKIQSFIFFFDGKPIGYIQCCPVKLHPWEGQDLPKEIEDRGAGIDLFIGEEEMLQKGLGSEILQHFLKEKIWPSYQYCLADPDIRNEASLRFFEKNGFKKGEIIHTKDALNRSVSLQLVCKKKG